METKRFKLIDKEGYLEIFMNNKNYLSKYFDSNLVSIPLTKNEDDDWESSGLDIVISKEELKFFEEYVEEQQKPKTKVGPIKLELSDYIEVVKKEVTTVTVAELKAVITKLENVIKDLEEGK